MSYDEFNEFLAYISGATKEPLPAFSIIQDLFDFIDIKKDGYIDLNEWVQTFNNIQVRTSPSSLTSRHSKERKRAMIF
jgi:hypothetical protein